MIPVLNVAYGPPDNLPFDMSHLRHPQKFDLSETSDNAKRQASSTALADETEGKRLGFSLHTTRQTLGATDRDTSDSPSFASLLGRADLEEMITQMRHDRDILTEGITQLKSALQREELKPAGLKKQRPG